MKNVRPALTAAEVIRLWNSVAEDTGSLEATILRFADLLLEAANHSAPPNTSTTA